MPLLPWCIVVQKFEATLSLCCACITEQQTCVHWHCHILMQGDKNSGHWILGQQNERTFFLFSACAVHYEKTACFPSLCLLKIPRQIALLWKEQITSGTSTHVISDFLSQSWRIRTRKFFLLSKHRLQSDRFTLIFLLCIVGHSPSLQSAEQLLYKCLCGLSLLCPSFVWSVHTPALLRACNSGPKGTTKVHTRCYGFFWNPCFGAISFKTKRSRFSDHAGKIRKSVESFECNLAQSFQLAKSSKAFLPWIRLHPRYRPTRSEGFSSGNLIASDNLLSQMHEYRKWDNNDLLDVCTIALRTNVCADNEVVIEPLCTYFCHNVITINLLLLFQN